MAAPTLFDTPLFDAHGKRVRLGAELGRGGEGTVFDLPGYAGYAAKLYAKPPGEDKAHKIYAMTGQAEARLLTLAAWPVATLHDAKGRLTGFGMPKIVGHRPVFQLYGPKLRLQHFPKADWRFLVRAATNAARAFRVVHDAGHVIGDVNHGNLVVGPDATVRFIDCDSFQVEKGGQRWLCDVGVGTHQPPEMQGLTSYRGVVRTSHQDDFGLAVILFQLLMLARHPFSGRFTGAGDPPGIEQAIAERRYAFSRDPGRTLMIAPGGAPPLDALTPTLQALFEAAFMGPAEHRPPAEAWIAALEELNQAIRRCPRNHAHYYYAEAGRCPWCSVEDKSGAQLFPIIFVAGPGDAHGVVALWAQICALPEPGVTPVLEPEPTGQAMPAPPVVQARQRLRTRRRAAYALMAVGTLLLLAFGMEGLRLWPLLAMAAVALGSMRVSLVAREVSARLTRLQAEWTALAKPQGVTTQVSRFRDLRHRLEHAKRDFDDLPNERTRRLESLSQDRHRRQLFLHLESFHLTEARIPGLGRAKIAMLQSHGIETAADIEARRIAPIPGFGPKTVATLMEFRHVCEARFRYDPAAGLAAADLAALDRDLAMRRQRLEAEFAQGLARMRALVADADQRRTDLMQRAARLRPALDQAKADAQALGLRV